MIRTFVRCTGLLAATALAASAWAQGGAAAASFPARPVKLVVAAAAGSSPDAIARMLTAKLSGLWKQPVVIENVAGLGGITGTDRAAKQPPDGYTLVVSTIAAMAVGSSLYEKMPYDPEKDLQPVTMVMSMPNLLVVHPSVPAHTLPELIAYAKRNPDKLRYGHPGTGTTPHLSAELFKQLAGVQMQGVPYKSSAQMTTDLLAGVYEVLFHNSSVMLPHAKGGTARILGITSAERNASLPEVPTVAEAGALKGFAVSAWWGLYAPAGTPPELVARISADVSAVLAQPDVKAWIEQQGGVPGGGTPQALRSYQADETQKWRAMIRNANIKAE